MRKFLIVLIVVLSLLSSECFAMIPVALDSNNTVLVLEATDLKTYKGYGGFFIAGTYDGNNTNGVAVTGIGGKESTDESIQIFSRVITAASNNDNFRADIDLLNLTDEGEALEDAIVEDSDGLLWFNTDIVYEFKIMPNKHVVKMTISDRKNSFAYLTNLSTTEWTNVKIVIDSDNMTSYTFVNGILHTKKTGLTKNTASVPACNSLRIIAQTTVPNEYEEQTEIKEDSDVWFYLDDLKISKTTAYVPTVYLEQTEKYGLSTGSRIRTDDGYNEIVGGVFGKNTTDKVFKMVASSTATDTISWYGYSNSATPVVTDLTTTSVDTIYETSFAVPEDIISVALLNNSAIVSFNKDVLRINQWNKVKAVFSHSTSKWKIYLNGEYYGESSASLDGRYKIQIKTPTGQSDTFYVDDIKIYQSVAGTESFEEATLKLPSVFEADGNMSVSDVKDLLNIKADDNAVFYEDDTYSTTLSDTDLVSDGNVIVAQNHYGVFQYSTISSKIHGSLVCGGSAKYSDTQFTTGTMAVNAYSEIPAQIYVAQYNKEGNLIDIAVSELNDGNISLEYQPLDVQGKLKIFLWDAEYKPIRESITMNYKRSMDVLIVGNSFSRDTLFYLRNIAKEYDIDINMGLAYSGGKNLEWHYDNRKEDVLSFYVNDFAASPVKDNTSLESILTDYNYDWDVIILQNYISDTPSSGKESIWEKGVSIAEYVHNVVPDAELKLNMIWSNEIGLGGIKNEAIQDETDTYLRTNNEQLAINIKNKLNLDYDVEVVPAGTAIATARDYVDSNGLNVFGATYYLDGYIALGDLYENDRSNKTYNYGYGVMNDAEKNAGMIKLNRDGFHLTPIARYLVSALWFESLTDESVFESTYTPPEDNNIMCQVITSDGSTYYLTGTFVAPDIEYVNIMKNIAHNMKQ